MTCLALFSLQFKRGSHPSVETSQRDDFRQYPPMTYFPDVTTRRKGLLMNDVSHDENYCIINRNTFIGFEQGSHLNTSWKIVPTQL